VVALGNTAAQSILETKDGVTKLRLGTGRTSPYFDGVRIIPTVHPAACLRQSDMFPSLCADIGKIGNNVSIRWEEPRYAVYDEATDAVRAIGQLGDARYPVVTFDIEVGIDKETDFGHAERYGMLCIGLGYAAGRAIVIGERACADGRVRRAFRTLFDSNRLAAHNGKFDVPGVRAYCSTGATLFFDTMLASYCLDERTGTNSLDYCAVELLGSPSWKHELDKYKGKNDSYAVVPRPVLYKYNAWDTANQHALYEYFVPELEKHDLRRTHDFLVEASNELMYPEMDGICIDPEYSEWLMEHYLESLEPLERDLCKVVGGAFNPRSPKQVKEVLEYAGLKVKSTDADTLGSILERTDDEEVATFCKLMLQHRLDAKAYGTYVKGIRKRLYEGRVHSTFLLHGTVSGRLSSRNPNLQNIPRDSIIRKQFVPAPGNIFLQGDYGQAELRVMATLSGDRYLREVFNDPSRDLFDEVGTRLYGDRAVGNKELRIRTKAYVYGLSYGREEFSIAAEFGISVKEAKRGMNAWMSLIPELRGWQAGIKHAVLHEQDDLITTFGRHRRFWLITKENQKDVVKEALSYYPQSTASDICLRALCRIRRALGSRGAVRIPVHDSILVECPIDEADEVAALMKHEMEASGSEWTDYVPFKVDIERGFSWGALK